MVKAPLGEIPAALRALAERIEKGDINAEKVPGTNHTTWTHVLVASETGAFALVSLVEDKGGEQAQSWEAA